MPLIDILSEVAADLGVDITNANDRSYLVNKINQAAKELYTSADLKGSLREQLFNIGSADQQVALPYYVDSIRGVRDYDSQLPITVQDMQPRYQAEGWKDFLGYKWRVKHKQYPLTRGILNIGPLTVTLSAPATGDLAVIVTGQTATASRLQETVAFSVGQQTKTTASLFTSIESIQKTAITLENVLVYDITNTLLAEIPNCEAKSSYTIIQVLDRDSVTSQDVVVEVLYKTRFTPFYNDYDSFPCGDLYDRAIFWKTLEFMFAKQDGPENTNRAIAANAKCNQVIVDIAENQETGVALRMQFPKNRFRNLHYILPRTWPQ